MKRSDLLPGLCRKVLFWNSLLLIGSCLCWAARRWSEQCFSYIFVTGECWKVDFLGEYVHLSLGSCEFWSATWRNLKCLWFWACPTWSLVLITSFNKLSLLKPFSEKHPLFFPQKLFVVFKKQYFNWSHDKSRAAVVVVQLHLLNRLVFNAKKICQEKKAMRFKTVGIKPTALKS